MTDKGYTTEEKIENFLNETISTGDADDYILAAQQLIDQETQRNFKADTNASERLYDGNDRVDLVIDDCVEITKVEVGSNYYGDSFTEIEEGGTSGYYLFPNNYSEQGLPIRKVHLRNRYWIQGIQNMRITAKWGYSASVPADISFVATMLSALMYKYGRSGAIGGIKSEKIGEYSISYMDDDELNDLEKAKNILNSYKKYTI